MTAKRISKTVVVGSGAVTTFNAESEFAGVGFSTPSNLKVTVLNPAAVVAIAWNGATAAVAGDDVRHIGPFGYEVIPYVRTLDLRSDTAATNVEISAV